MTLKTRAQREARKEDLRRVVGNNVRRLRKLRGQTQRDLAEKLGKTVQAVRLWEKAKNTMTLFSAVEVCRELDTTLSRLVTEVTEVAR